MDSIDKQPRRGVRQNVTTVVLKSEVARAPASVCMCFKIELSIVRRYLPNFCVSEGSKKSYRICIIWTSPTLSDVSFGPNGLCLGDLAGSFVGLNRLSLYIWQDLSFIWIWVFKCVCIDIFTNKLALLRQQQKMPVQPHFSHFWFHT